MHDISLKALRNICENVSHTYLLIIVSKKADNASSNLKHTGYSFLQWKKILITHEYIDMEFYLGI